LAPDDLGPPGPGDPAPGIGSPYSPGTGNPHSPGTGNPDLPESGGPRSPRTGGGLGPVQQAFADCHGLQCGFCTPGVVTPVTAYIRDPPDPTPAEAPGAVAGSPVPPTRARH